jgi:hypothetical protein
MAWAEIDLGLPIFSSSIYGVMRVSFLRKVEIVLNSMWLDALSFLVVAAGSGYQLLSFIR